MTYLRNHRFALALAALLVSVAGGLAWAGSTDVQFYDRGQFQVHTGTTDVDVSASDYTAFTTLLTVAPAANTAMHDVKIALDLDKTTTGWNAEYAARTGQLALQRKIDGTNWRTDVASITSLIHGSAGTDAVATSYRVIDAGTVTPTEGLRVVILVSAEDGDCEFPYVVTYRAPKVATFTDVAN